MATVVGPAPCQRCGRSVWWHPKTGWVDRVGRKHVCVLSGGK